MIVKLMIITALAIGIITLSLIDNYLSWRAFERLQAKVKNDVENRLRAKGIYDAP